MRILWFFITLATGVFPGVVTYLLAWIIIPKEPELKPVVVQLPVTSYGVARVYKSLEYYPPDHADLDLAVPGQVFFEALVERGTLHLRWGWKCGSDC